MVKLEQQDFQQLVALLQGQDLMQDDRSRRQMLRMAGLEQVLPLLDLQGAPFTVTSNIVSFLASAPSDKTFGIASLLADVVQSQA